MPDYIRELYLLESESDRLPFREEADHRAVSLELDSCHTQIQKAMGKDFFERYYDLLSHQRDLEELTFDLMAALKRYRAALSAKKFASPAELMHQQAEEQRKLLNGFS